MRRFIAAVLLLSVLIAGCGPASTVEPVKLNVFAASSLTDAFTEIGENFEAANSTVRVTFNFAGSQSLRTQIEEGAPADVFASASGREMDAAVAGKFIAEGKPQIFLNNKLVVILPADNPAGL